MKNLYFVRHGLSQANVDRLWSGHYDTLLVDEGRVQAAKAGEKLVSDGIEVDLIISSPLIRTQETARIIAETINYPVERILTEKLLIERTFGVLEGKKSDEFFRKYAYTDLDTIEGAETIQDLQSRALELLNALRERNENTILLVSHGSFGRALRRAVKGQPYTDEYSNNWSEQVINNAEIIKLI